MGFVKFARVFRFIGLFLGVNVLAYGLLLLNMDKFPSLQETIAQSAQGTGYTIEELIQTWKAQGLVIAIVGGVLMVFGIICFIIFGVNKWKLESSSSNSNYNNYQSSYSPSSESKSAYINGSAINLSKWNKYLPVYEETARWWFSNSPDALNYKVEMVAPKNSNNDYAVYFTFWYNDDLYTTDSNLEYIKEQIVERINSESHRLGGKAELYIEVKVN